VKDGQLVLRPEGNSFANSSPMLVNPADRKYEVRVEYTIDPGTTAGLCLFYNEQGNLRISVDQEKFTVFNQQSAKIREKNTLGNHGFLRILNDENEISFYYSADGKSWNRVERSIDATGFNHNIFGGFMSLRAGLFAFGEGEVRSIILFITSYRKICLKMRNDLINRVALFIMCVVCAIGKTSGQAVNYPPISMAPFGDSMRHWYGIHDDSNIVNPVKNQPRYPESEITKIADNILLFQRNNGVLAQELRHAGRSDPRTGRQPA
jgi:hypothetical protein